MDPVRGVGSWSPKSLIFVNISSSHIELLVASTEEPLTQNISPSVPIRQSHLEPLASLDHANLARLHKQLAKLRLDIQSSLLGYNQPVAVGIHRCSAAHARVGEVRVHCQPLAQRRVAGAGDGLETADEVDFAIFRDVEGKPGELRGGDVDAGVQGEEVGLSVGVIGEVGLRVVVSIRTWECIVADDVV